MSPANRSWIMSKPMPGRLGDPVAQLGRVAGEGRPVALDRVARPAPRLVPVAMEVDRPGHDLADRRRVAPDVAAMVGEGRQLALLDRRDVAVRQPPVGVLGHRPQQVLLAAPADHDRGQGIGPRLAPGVLDGVELALERGRRLGPHRLDQPERLVHPRDPLAGRRERVAVGAVLVLEPAGAVAEDEPPAAQRLDACRHLGHQRADGGTSWPARCGRAAPAAPARPARSAASTARSGSGRPPSDGPRPRPNRRSGRRRPSGC